MAKRLSEEEKEEIVQSFCSGVNINELANIYKFTKLTISRNLKNNLGEKIFKEFLKKNNSKNKVLQSQNANLLLPDKKDKSDTNKNNFDQEKNSSENKEEQFSSSTPFIELTPLNFEIESHPQKDLSSMPISEAEFPKIVYMIVGKKIELETKYLRDYPEWQFLSENELNRKTIQIFLDLKIAKKFCNQEQKVLKVPNTNVFKIVAPLLLSRGISRIVSDDKLIAL